MNHLSKNQVDQINEQIEKQGISYAPLRDELLDHVCSDVENKMNNGNSFHEAYNNICKQFELEPLINIEKDTLEILNKKLDIKTKIVYSLIGVFTFSVLFKFLRFPGSGMMIIFSLGGLTILFLLTAIINLIKRYKTKEQPYLSFTSIFFSFFIYATLSVVLGWGDDIFLRVISLFGIGLIFTYQSYRLIENHVLYENGFTMVLEKHFRKIEITIFLFTIIVFLMILYLPVSPSYVVYPLYNFSLALITFLCYGATWIIYITKPEKFKDHKKLLFIVSTILFWLTLIFLSHIIQDTIFKNILPWVIILSGGLYGLLKYKKDSNAFSFSSIFLLVLITFCFIKIIFQFHLFHKSTIIILEQIIHSPVSLIFLLIAMYLFRKSLLPRSFLLFILVVFIGTIPVKSLPNDWLLYKLLKNRPHVIKFIKSAENEPYNNAYYQKLEHLQRATKTNHFFNASCKFDNNAARILNDLIPNKNQEFNIKTPSFQWNNNPDEIYWAEYNLARLEPLSTMFITWGKEQPKTLTISVYTDGNWVEIEKYNTEEKGLITKYSFALVYASKIRISFKNPGNETYKMYEWNTFHE